IESKAERRSDDVNNPGSNHCAHDCLHFEIARATDAHVQGLRGGPVIRIDWDPIGHLGPIPINWYGLGWAAAFLVGWYLVRRWASASSIKPSTVDDVIVWIMLGSMLGARLYYVVQYAPVEYLMWPVARHPDQYYELLGDLIIAVILLRLRGRFPDGALFLTYLVLFSVLRFFLFFVRGNVPVIALGLKNGQWTAAAIVVVSLPMLLAR